jgi:dipeptidyl aminopeptidase/acylaminoacyl peptidase
MLSSQNTKTIKYLSAAIYFLGFLNVSYAEKNPKPLWTSKDAVTYAEADMKDVSSDGRFTLLQVYNKSIKEGKTEAYSQCLVVDNKTLKTRTLGHLHHSCDSSKFVGDGKQFSYLIEDKNGELTLYVRNISSWKENKIQKLDKNSARHSFAPDGRSIIFEIVEQPEESLRKVAGEDVVPKSKFYIQKLDQNFQLANKEPLILTLEKDSDTPFSLETLDWAPNGNKLAFLISAPIWKSEEKRRMYVMDLKTQATDKIAEGSALFHDIRFSSHGESIAFMKAEGGGNQTGRIKPSKEVHSQAIHIVNLITQKKIIIPIEDPGELAGWAEDDRTLILTKQNGTTNQIYSLDVATKKLSLLKTPHIPCVKSVILSKDNKYIGFNGESLHQPAGAYITNLNKFVPKKINSPAPKNNLKAIQAHPLKWKSFDGLEIEGIIIYPQNYKKQQKVPLIVSIHGGPVAFESQRFIGGMWFGPYSPAVFASEGYATLVVNYRGSIGYGKKFTGLNTKDFGEAEFKDIMAGVDLLIDQGIADPDQLFIRGHSYGGFLTAWALGHTNQFKAACVSAGIVDWISDISTTDAPTYMEGYFGGNYWENYKLWYKISPLSYIKNIETPTLILHGLEDKRVSIGQPAQLYQALNEKDIPARLLFYYNQGHHFNGILPAKDAIEETLAWFNKHKHQKGDFLN